MPNGEGSDELIINCDIEYTDLIVKDNKFVSIYCNNVSIDEEASSKEFKEAFEVTPDGDYHILIEFKKIHKSCESSQNIMKEVNQVGES